MHLLSNLQRKDVLNSIQNITNHIKMLSFKEFQLCQK